jgi:gas vesicle protein
MKKSNIYVTFFFGVTGIVSGILFAPGKGSKTRRELSRKGLEYKEFISDHYNDFVDTVSRPPEDEFPDQVTWHLQYVRDKR